MEENGRIIANIITNTVKKNNDYKTGKNGKGLGVGRRKGDKGTSNPGAFTTEKSKALRAKDDPEKKRLGGLKQSVTKNTKATLQRVTSETQDFLRQELLTPDEFGHIYVHDFITSFLTEAKSNPNSRAAAFLAQSMFTPDLLTKLDAQADAAMAKDMEFTRYRLRNTLYDKQQEVFDNTLDKRIEIICSRRSGKSELNARLLIKDFLKGGKKERHALYINRNFDNAVSQGYDKVVPILDSLGIPYQPSRGNGVISFNNGSDIKFRGANNKGDIDRERGNLFSTIICDECGHLRNLDHLFSEVLEPATIDYEDSQIFLTGTPPRSKHQFAYKTWQNPAWRHYHWTYLDNPFIPNRENVLEEVCKNHGLTKDAAFIQREYLGSLEAFDSDCLIFRGYKTIDAVNKGTYDRAYIGVDWGFEDEASVVSFVVKDKKMLPVEEWHMSKQSITAICNEIRRQLGILKSFGLAYEPYIICDTNEKSAVYELYETYGLSNVYCAYKYNKDMAIEQLAEWLRTDYIYVKKDGYLAQECEDTLWKRDEETDEIRHEIDDDNYHPNGMMALLYISRQFAYDVLGYVDCAATEINEEK